MGFNIEVPMELLSKLGIIPILFLVVILPIAAVYDIRFQKIPNWLTFPTMGAGIVFYTCTTGLKGLIFSVEGLLLGMALFMVFYVCAGMGAGDVKLMGAIGSVLGLKGVFAAFLGTALVGGVYAIILLTLHGLLKETVKRYGGILKVFLFTGKFVYCPPDAGTKLPVLNYGIAIAFGTLFSIMKNIYS